MSLDMRDVTAIQIPVYDTHYYREIEYLSFGYQSPNYTSYSTVAPGYTLEELLNGGSVSIKVSDLYGGSSGDYTNLINLRPYDGDYPALTLGFKPQGDNTTIAFWYHCGDNSTPIVNLNPPTIDRTHTFILIINFGTLGNQDTVLSFTDETTNTNIYTANVTLPAGFSSYLSTELRILGGAVGGYYGLKLYEISVTIDNVEHNFYPAQDKLYNTTDEKIYGGSMYDSTDRKLASITNSSPSTNVCGSVVNENPGWQYAFVNTYDVTKIEDYYNGNLRQIWPCWSPGPSNPSAPVVTNAFDYDDTITWTIGTGVENTDEYYYYPITATGQANGVQIALADNPNGWPSDGKPSNNSTYTWYVQAERAGYYQMIMHAKMSSAAHATTGYWSYLNLRVNDSTTGVHKLNSYGQTPDFDAVDYHDVVVAVVQLTGNVDKISFQQGSYRIVVDPSSNIIFREIDDASPAIIELGITNVQTTFTAGDTFNYNGLEVTQYLLDGTSSTISSGYTVSTPDMSTAGTQNVTVTYNGLKDFYTITINPAAGGGAPGWSTTATLTNTDSQTFEQGTLNNVEGVRIALINYSSGGFGSDGRVSSTGTLETYKITPPSAGDYMLVLPIRKGSGNPIWEINSGSPVTVTLSASNDYDYIEIYYPITLTAGENTLTIRNSSYRCYFDLTDYVYLFKSSTNPIS